MGSNGGATGHGIWYNLPLIRVEDILHMKLRITVLEDHCSNLEDRLLTLERQARLDVSRETYAPQHLEEEWS